MSQFYGTVQGGRGRATRCGHKSIVTYAASWSGAIRVEMYERGGEQRVCISAEPWEGRGPQEALNASEAATLNLKFKGA